MKRWTTRGTASSSAAARSPRAPLRLAAIGAAAACLACVGAAADEEGVQASWARWKSAAVGAYRYAYHKHCECYRDTPPETVVAVRAGAVARVHHVYAGSDREVPAREGSLDLYWTIDDLFALIASAAERGAVVRARYDASLGYPTAVFIDYDPSFVGDEIDVRVAWLAADVR